MAEAAVQVKPAKSKRNLVHIELFRIIAIWLVMFNHTNENGFFLFCSYLGTPVSYYLTMALTIICKLAVPLFFMISGALLLGRDESISTVYSKRISRMVIVIVVISIIDQLYDCFRLGAECTVSEFLIKLYQCDVVVSLWFLYTYVALLMMLPLLRKMARSMTAVDYVYFGGMALLFYGCIPLLEYRLGLDKVRMENSLRPVLFIFSSVFSFMMGYFFEKVLDKKYYTWSNAFIAIILSIISVAITCYVINFQVGEIGVCDESHNQTFLTCLIAIPTYTTYFVGKLFFDKVEVPQWIKTSICFVGATTFGIYLFDKILREETKFLLTDLKPVIGTLPACITWITVAFCIGCVVVWVLKKIPLVAKYI